MREPSQVAAIFAEKEFAGVGHVLIIRPFATAVKRDDDEIGPGGLFADQPAGGFEVVQIV